MQIIGKVGKKIGTAINDYRKEKAEERKIYKDAAKQEKRKQIRLKAKKDIRDKNKRKKDLWGDL